MPVPLKKIIETKDYLIHVLVVTPTHDYITEATSGLVDASAASKLGSLGIPVMHEVLMVHNLLIKRASKRISISNDCPLGLIEEARMS